MALLDSKCRKDNEEEYPTVTKALVDWDWVIVEGTMWSISTRGLVRKEVQTCLPTPMILNLILSHNSVFRHFCKQHGNLYMTAKSIFENSNLLKTAFLIWHRTD